MRRRPQGNRFARRWTGLADHQRLDADVAGVESIKRGIDEAEKFDFEIRVVVIDFAKDPDEAIKKDPEKFKKLIFVHSLNNISHA